MLCIRLVWTTRGAHLVQIKVAKRHTSGRVRYLRKHIQFGNTRHGREVKADCLPRIGRAGERHVLRGACVAREKSVVVGIARGLKQLKGVRVCCAGHDRPRIVGEEDVIIRRGAGGEVEAVVGGPAVAGIDGRGSVVGGPLDAPVAAVGNVGAAAHDGGVGAAGRGGRDGGRDTG